MDGINYSRNLVVSSFLGHSVYKSRALIAGLRYNTKKHEIFIQACECFYKLPNRDISTYKLPLEIWDSLISKRWKV